MTIAAIAPAAEATRGVRWRAEPRIAEPRNDRQGARGHENQADAEEGQEPKRQQPTRAGGCGSGAYCNRTREGSDGANDGERNQERQDERLTSVHPGPIGLLSQKPGVAERGCSRDNADDAKIRAGWRPESHAPHSTRPRRSIAWSVRVLSFRRPTIGSS
jgi:hypothetical protein